MSDNLFEIVAGVLNVPANELALETGPANLAAWDSLAQITIVAAVEQTYGIQLSMPEILSIHTINHLKQILAKYSVIAE